MENIFEQVTKGIAEEIFDIDSTEESFINIKVDDSSLDDSDRKNFCEQYSSDEVLVSFIEKSLIRIYCKNKNLLNARDRFRLIVQSECDKILFNHSREITETTTIKDLYDQYFCKMRFDHQQNFVTVGKFTIKKESLPYGPFFIKCLRSASDNYIYRFHDSGSVPSKVLNQVCRFLSSQPK